MKTHKQLVTQMHSDIFVIDPLGAYNGIDRLGPALPEQKRDWKRKQREIAKLTTKETVITNLFFTVFFAAFLVGRMSLGSNPIEDSQEIFGFFAGLMK